jgi:hypothetical protein
MRLLVLLCAFMGSCGISVNESGNYQIAAVLSVRAASPIPGLSRHKAIHGQKKRAEKARKKTITKRIKQVSKLTQAISGRRKSPKMTWMSSLKRSALQENHSLNYLAGASAAGATGAAATGAGA